MNNILKMSVVFALCLSVLGLSGCSTPYTFEIQQAETSYQQARMKDWIDASEIELVSVWGKPTSIYKINDNEKILQYLMQGNQVVVGKTSSNAVGGSILGSVDIASGSTTTTAVTKNNQCLVFFGLKNGQIISHNSKGNLCTATPGCGKESSCRYPLPRFACKSCWLPNPNVNTVPLPAHCPGSPYFDEKANILQGYEEAGEQWVFCNLR